MPALMSATTACQAAAGGSTCLLMRCTSRMRWSRNLLSLLGSHPVTFRCPAHGAQADDAGLRSVRGDIQAPLNLPRPGLGTGGLTSGLGLATCTRRGSLCMSAKEGAGRCTLDLTLT